MGDISESAETCATPALSSFSGGCAISGGITGGLLGGFLAGGGAIGGAAGAGGGLVAGALIGYCACRLSGRLRKISSPLVKDGEVMLVGRVLDVGRSSIFFPWGDGDFLFNVATPQTFLLTEAFDGSQACVRFKAGGPQFLHCEISSNVTALGCAGMVAGAVAGAVVGTGLGTAAGVAVAAACLATGIFAPLCILAAILVALIVSAAVTAAAAQAGAAVGGAAGALADEIEGQLADAGADAVKEGDCVVFSGDWVTDRDHGWNEMHDVKRAMVMDVAPESCGAATGAVGAGLVAREAVIH